MPTDEEVQARLDSIRGSIGIVLHNLRELGNDVGLLVADLRADGRLADDSYEVLHPSLVELDSFLTRALEHFMPPRD